MLWIYKHNKTTQMENHFSFKLCEMMSHKLCPLISTEIRVHLIFISMPVKYYAIALLLNHPQQKQYSNCLYFI